MAALNLKDEMGIEGDVAWLLEAAEFPDLLSQVYRAHFGEIWLFNNDLNMILDEKFFPALYLDKISKTLANHVLSVKVLVSSQAEKYLKDLGNPASQLQRQALRIREVGGTDRLETIYFGYASEAKKRFPDLSEIPDSHSWVFYAHRADIRSPSHGVVIVRPNEFPFRDVHRDEHYAIAWQMQRAHLLRRKLQQAFCDCFGCEDLFSYISAKSSRCSWATRWSKATKGHSTRFNTPHTHDPLALGEEAGAVVLASRDDEHDILRELIKERLHAQVSPVPAPRGHGPYSCANIPTSSGRMKILFAEIGEGVVTAGIRTAEILSRWNPTHVILCGVAGADATADKSLNIGDVVIGESVINYEDGTIYEAGKQIHRSKVRNAAASAIPAWRFRPRSDRNSWGVMETSLFRIADALCNSWVFGKSGLQQMGLDVGNLEVTGKFQIKDAFDARSTVIGSGSKVVSACQYFPDMIRFASEKIDTVETEAAGVCRACAMARPAKTALVVRGIMDHANRRTRGGKVKKVGRLIANASCSHFVFTLLQSLDSGK